MFIEVPSEQTLWESIAQFGFVLVILGVILEGAELFVKWGKKRRSRRRFGEKINRRLVLATHWLHLRILPVETMGFLILVFGLGVEFIGGLRAIVISHKIATIEQRKVEQLRADNIEQQKVVERLRAENIQQQKSLERLKAGFNDRLITAQQRQQFIELASTIPKLPVLLDRRSIDGGEADGYANQIKQMLLAGGFYDGGERALMGSGPGNPKGVTIMTPGIVPDRHPFDFNWPLRQAFEKIGVPVTWVTNTGSSVIVLMVGPKPPPE